MYIEKVLDLWVQLMKNGGKNKSVVFIILVSVAVFLFLDNLVWQFTRWWGKLSQVHILYSTVYNSVMR